VSNHKFKKTKAKKSCLTSYEKQNVSRTRPLSRCLKLVPLMRPSSPAGSQVARRTFCTEHRHPSSQGSRRQLHLLARPRSASAFISVNTLNLPSPGISPPLTLTPSSPALCPSYLFAYHVYLIESTSAQLQGCYKPLINPQQWLSESGKKNAATQMCVMRNHSLWFGAQHTAQSHVHPITGLSREKPMR